MTNIITSYLSFLPLVSRGAPDARVVAIGGIDFTQDTQYQVDLTAAVNSAQLPHPIQSVFLDASACMFGTTTLQVAGTGQRIVIQPWYQGYFPILNTKNSFIFSFTNTFGLGRIDGTMSVFAHFLTIPVVASVWSAQQTDAGYGVGPLGEVGLGQ